jgi:hypothetical protein
VAISRRYVPQIIIPNAAAYFPIHNNNNNNNNNNNTVTVTVKSGYASHFACSVSTAIELTVTQCSKRRSKTLYCAANQWAQLFLVVKFLLFTINSYMFRLLYQILRRFIPVALWMTIITINSAKTQLFIRVLIQQHVSA